MNDTRTRAVSHRKTLVLLLLFTATIFFSRVGAMAQGLGTDDFWTTVGSTGTVDESDRGIVDFDTFSVGHKAGKTGTVNIRYNIVAIEGANQGDTKPFNGIHQIRVRYLDSDGHGSNAQVRFFIYRTNVVSGFDQNIFTFDSNINGEDTGAAQTATKTDCGTRFEFDFDFSRYFYWIDAEVTRNNTMDVARLDAIQITELTTTCGSP